MTNAQLNAALDGHKGQNPILNSPEISVWMTAFGGLREIADLYAAHEAGKLSTEKYYQTVNAMLVELAETADLTHQFGILLPAAIEPNYKRRLRVLFDAFIKVEFSPSFWRWFNWWDDYMKSLPQADRNNLYKLVTYRLPEVETFRPLGDWIGYRNEPAIVLCKP